MNAQQENFKQPFYASGKFMNHDAFGVSLSLLLALLFERYFDDASQTHSVEIWYKNNEEFTDLTAETCGESPCSLDQLELAWLPVIPLVRAQQEIVANSFSRIGMQSATTWIRAQSTLLPSKQNRMSSLSF